MARRSKDIPPESEAYLRTAWQTRAVSIEAMATTLNMSPRTLQRRAEERGWARLPPSSGIDGAIPPPVRNDAAVHLSVLLERQIAAVEHLIGMIDPERSAGTEDAARQLAMLARTFKELVQLRPKVPQPSAFDEDDDDMPRDIDEFRDSLAQRIEKLIAAEVDAAVSGRSAVEGTEPSQS